MFLAFAGQQQHARITLAGEPQAYGDACALASRSAPALAPCAAPWRLSFKRDVRDAAPVVKAHEAREIAFAAGRSPPPAATEGWWVVVPFRRRRGGMQDGQKPLVVSLEVRLQAM